MPGSPLRDTDRLRQGKVPQAEVEGSGWQALEEARPWIGLDYHLWCDLVPALSFSVFECQVHFANGASSLMDVDPGGRRVGIAICGAVNQPR